MTTTPNSKIPTANGHGGMTKAIELAHSAGRAGCRRGGVIGGALAIAGSAWAGPQDAKVVVGDVTFTRQGNVWIITASNGAIINYASFDILPYETVQFLQPSQVSRVLNRINSAMPTRIDGTLLANGQVYFVNPAGVMFGKGAVLDVGGLYAAAGSISNQDFVAGNTHFTGLSGEVRNEGTIHSQDTVALIGRQATNFGTIVSPQGTVVMAAGKDVFIGKEGSNVYAKVQGAGDPALANQTGVTNTGTIQANAALMSAGDTYGMAIFNTGKIQAKTIAVDGGSSGVVRIEGQLDASDRSATGHGGSITITGEKVGLFDATVDATGGAGGGSVKIGGDLQGQGTLHHAKAVYIDEKSSVLADALTSGAGGNVVVYSDGTTRILGELSVQGSDSGAGGFVETSGHYVAIKNAPELGSRSGNGGRWLLDPFDVHIVAGNGSADFGDPNDPFDNPTVNDSNLGVQVIQTALQSGSVTVSTGGAGSPGAQNGDIFVETNLDFDGIGSSGRTLTLNAARNITFSNGVSIADSNTGTADKLNLTLNANFAAIGAGNVSLSNSTINLGGGTLATGANTVNFTMSGAVTAGSVSVSNTGTTTIAGSLNAPIVLVNSTGLITVDSTAQAVNIGTNGGSAVAIVGGGITFTGGNGNTLQGSLVQIDAGTNTLTISGNTAFGAGANTLVANDMAWTANVSGTGTLTVAPKTAGRTIELAGAGAANTLALSAAELNKIQAGFTQITFGSPTASFTGNINIAGNYTGFNSNIRFTSNSGTILLNGNVTSTGSLRFDKAVDITQGAGVTLTGTTMTFNSTIDSSAGGRMILTNSGTATLNGVVGGINPLLQFVTNGAGTVILPSAVSTAGNQSYNNVTLTGTTTTLTTNGGAILFNGTVDGTTAGTQTLLAFSNGGGITIGGAVGGTTTLAALTADAGGGGITFAGSGVTTSGAQSYIGNTTLNSTVTLVSTGGSNIGITGTIDGDANNTRSLTFSTSGVSTINGAVGATHSLASLLTIGGGRTDLGGNVTSTVVGFGGALKLLTNSTITATTANFGGTIDATTAGAQSLTVAASGTATFNGVVGGTTALNNFSSNGAGTTTLKANVNTVGSQAYSATVLNASAITLTATGAASNITFTGALDGTTNGATDLTLTGGSSGLVTLANVGATHTLNSLTTTGTAGTVLNGAVTVVNNATFAGAVQVAGASSVTGKNITFSGTVDSDSVGAGKTLTVTNTTGGMTVFTGAVGGTNALTSLTAAGPGVTELHANVTTTDTQTYSGPVQLFADVTLTSTNNLAIGFTGTVDSDTNANHRNLTVATTGAVSFGAAVGGTNALGTLTSNGSTTIAGGAITTAGAQTYNGTVNLTADTTLTASEIDFTANVTGAGKKLVITAFDPTENINVGGASDAGASTLDLTAAEIAFIQGGLTSLDIGTAAYKGTTAVVGNTTFADTVNFNGDFANGSKVTLAANVSGSNDIRFFTPVTLLANAVTVASTGAGAITFDKAVDGDAAGTRALTVNTTGVTTFKSALGGAFSLASLTTDAGGSTVLDGNVTSAGAVAFNDAVTLGADVTVAGVGVTFGSTLDSDNTATKRALTVNDTGTTNFNGIIGGTTALSTLTTDAAGTTHLGANVTTSGNQVFNDDVTVAAGVTVTSGGNFVVGKTLTTAGALTGTITGRTAVAGATLLGGTTSITSGTIFFGSTIDGNAATPDVTLIATTAGSGSVIPIGFGGSIGNTVALGNLTLGGTLSSVPNVSTIVFAEQWGSNNLPQYLGVVNGIDNFVVNCANFTMGQYNKITAFGNISLIASGGVATIGDVTSIGNIVVNAATINVMRRPAGGVLGAFGVVENDQGVDFVAGGTIDFNVTPTLVGAGNTPAYSATNTDPELGAFFYRIFTGGVSVQLFRDNGAGGTGSNLNLLGLDLKADGPTSTNPATALAGATPRFDETDRVSPGISVDDTVRRFFAELDLVLTEDQAFEDTLDSLIGRSLYSDYLQPGQTTTHISSSRLTLEAVEPVMATYISIFKTTSTDPNTGERTVTDRDEEVRRILGDSWADYAGKVTGNGRQPTGAGWRDYLSANGGSNGEQALEILDGLNRLFRQLESLGLSQYELRAPKASILRRARDSRIPDGQGGSDILWDAIRGESTPASGATAMLIER